MIYVDEVVEEMLHIEVRKKIVEARRNGLQIKEICKAYNVGASAVFRLLRQERETGDIAPKTHLRGRKPTLDEQGLTRLRELLDTRKDITLAEIIANQEDCGVRGHGRKHYPPNGGNPFLTSETTSTSTNS